MRIDGLVSGLDTTSLVTQLIELEKGPLKRLQSEQSEIQRLQDAWRSLNTRLLNLENIVKDLKAKETFISRKVTSSAADVASATASTNALPGSYRLRVEQLATAHRLASARVDDVDGALGEVDEEGNPLVEGEIIINGKTISLSSAQSLRDIQNLINETEDIGVEAKIIDNRLVLISTETGLENAIEVVDENGLLQQLGLLEGDWQVVQEAQDAVIYLDGLRITRSSNVISDAVEGVTFTLKAAGETELSITFDTQRAVDKLKAFVNQYNSVIDYIQQGQSKSEVTGTVGIFFADGTARTLATSLRRVVTDAVSHSEFHSIASLGIEIDRYGKMSLDEKVLVDVLEKDPDAVRRFFYDGEQGVAVRIEAFVAEYTRSGDGVIANRQDCFTRRTQDIKKQIEYQEYRIERKEESLYRQFAAMEKALAQMMGQSDWLQAQLTSLNNLTRQGNRR